MRFEKLEPQKQAACLWRLYKRLNTDVFCGSLRDDVGIGVEIGPREYAGSYTRRTARIAPAITVSTVFIESLSKLKTQREQAAEIIRVLLHEMIHQYCDQNGIEDTDHGEAWQQAAAAHGLHSVYQNGNQVEEWLDPEGLPAFLAAFFVKIY